MFKLFKQKNKELENKIKDLPEYIFKEDTSEELASSFKSEKDNTIYKYYRIALKKKQITELKDAYNFYIMRVNYSIHQRSKYKHIWAEYYDEVRIIKECNHTMYRWGEYDIFMKLYSIWEYETSEEKNTPGKCSISEKKVTKEVLSSWKSYITKKLNEEM